jgi:hypothetical protein
MRWHEQRPCPLTDQAVESGGLTASKVLPKPKHVWSIHQQLKMMRRVANFELFKLVGIEASNWRRSAVKDERCRTGGPLRERRAVIKQETGRSFRSRSRKRDALAAWFAGEETRPIPCLTRRALSGANGPAPVAQPQRR